MRNTPPNREVLGRFGRKKVNAQLGIVKLDRLGWGMNPSIICRKDGRLDVLERGGRDVKPPELDL